VNGNVTINGVSEKSLLKILKFKVVHEGQFVFNPAQAQQQQPNPQVPPTYNNVVIGRANDDQMRTVLQVLNLILKPT
jgi:hypothetical protein